MVVQTVHDSYNATSTCVGVKCRQEFIIYIMNSWCRLCTT